MKSACCIGLILSFFIMEPVKADLDQWEDIGPRAGTAFHAAVHPASLDTIYASLEEGIYKSTDGGDAWSKLTQLPAPAFQIVFDPLNYNVIYAWTGGKIHKSYDCGGTWTQITSFSVSSFTLDLNHPNRLYAGSFHGIYTYEANVYVSTDGGASWTETKTGAPCIGDGCFVTALTADPSDSNTVYAGITGNWDFPGSGVYKTTDGCLTWESASSGLPPCNIECLEIDPDNPSTLYAGTSGGGMYSGAGVFKTTDGGAIWTEINTGLPRMGWGCGWIDAIRLNPNQPEILFASVDGSLFKSVNGGSNWFSLDMVLFQASINSIELFPGDTEILFFGSSLGVVKGESGGTKFSQMGILPVSVSSVAADHENSGTIYATGRGTFKSTDSGAHWQPINKNLHSGQVITQDPSSNRVLYLGSYSPSGAVFRTTNAGSTWVKTSLRDVAINDIAVDPTNSDIVFAGGLEDPFVGGVFKSEDGGASWTTVDQSQTDCIAVDPQNPMIVYAGGHSGLRKSIDGGAHWFPIQDGLNLPESGYVLAVAVNPHHTNVVYCGTYKAGVFKSIDGGAHWENASEGITPTSVGNKDIRDLAIDPSDPNILYAGTWGSGVFVSVDGADSWHRLGATSGSSRGLCLAVDPKDPNIIYSAGGGLWRYMRTTSCAAPEIISCCPTTVNSVNCTDGCEIAFEVHTEDDCSEAAVVSLERRYDGPWTQEDCIVAPDPEGHWVLRCTVDEHFTDGEHEFRAVIRCTDGAWNESESVIVTADRGESVAFSAFEAAYSDGRVELHWSVDGVPGLRGFHVYRSLLEDSGFRRINDSIIPVDGTFSYTDSDLDFGVIYWYRVGAVDEDGEWFSPTQSVQVPSPSLALFQNYPNPFNPSTTISFTLPEKSRVNLSVFNIEGKLMHVLLNGSLDRGYQRIKWDGCGAGGNPVSSGVYFYRLQAGGKVLTRKMVLVR